MSDNSNMNNRPQLERRQSVAASVFSSARNWFNGGNGGMGGKDMGGGHTFDHVKQFADTIGNGNGNDDEMSHQNSMRQRSKSLAYCERRDLLVPGPVF